MPVYSEYDGFIEHILKVVPYGMLPKSNVDLESAPVDELHVASHSCFQLITMLMSSLPSCG